MKLSNGRIFLIAMAVGAVYVVAYSCITTRSRREKSIRKLDKSEIYLTDQLRPSDFPQLARLDIATIVDMRPDGEASDQMPSRQAAEISKQRGMAFEYVPIPHGDIPSAGVDRLSSILSNGKRPMLLYCRTGKRALRTFCLAEAARKGGHTAEELNVLADRTGFGIKDLRPEIARRIAARGSQ